MEELSELGRMLVVGQALLDDDRTADYLMRRVSVSAATLKRYLGELRSFGCLIVSRRESSGWVYRLENRGEVRTRLERWLELERTRSLVGP